MTIYKIFIFIIFIELIFFAIILSLIIIKRFIFYFTSKYHSKVQAKISSFLMKCIDDTNKALPELLPKKLRKFKDLLSVVETFDQRLKDESWEILKIKIVSYYLLIKAQKMTYSFFWKKRQLAARCFSLATQEKNEKDVLHLLLDKSFLVRASASIAAAKIKSKKTIFALIKIMSKSTGYERSFYKDILHSNFITVLEHIKEIAETEKNISIHIAALEILSTQTSSLNLSIIKKDLTSKNKIIRRLTLKILSINPYKFSEKILLKTIKSTDETEREIATFALRNFSTKDSIEALSKSLNDDSWNIRIAASKALKNIGEKGIKILKSQTKEKNKDAYEASQYILQFY